MKLRVNKASALTIFTDVQAYHIIAFYRLIVFLKVQQLDYSINKLFLITKEIVVLFCYIHMCQTGGLPNLNKYVFIDCHKSRCIHYKESREQIQN